MKPRIAILFHKNDRSRNIRFYDVTTFANIWREKGFDVFFLFGVRDYVPADILFLHIDLSVVPEEYLSFAKRYPCVINENVTDIRKSMFSEKLLSVEDTYNGPVIVKTDLNCAGRPEFNLSYSSRWRRQLTRRILKFTKPSTIESSLEYCVYPSLSNVPTFIFDDSTLIVEKFLPERDGENYQSRFVWFLGDRMEFSRLTSTSPIVKGVNASHEHIEPDEALLSFRKKFSLDYGKIDYVYHQEELVILDINKTTGGRIIGNRPNRVLTKAAVAEGIHSFLT